MTLNNLINYLTHLQKEGVTTLNAWPRPGGARCFSGAPALSLFISKEPRSIQEIVLLLQEKMGTFLFLSLRVDGNTTLYLCNEEGNSLNNDPFTYNDLVMILAATPQCLLMEHRASTDFYGLTEGHPPVVPSGLMESNVEGFAGAQRQITPEQVKEALESKTEPKKKGIPITVRTVVVSDKDYQKYHRNLGAPSALAHLKRKAFKACEEATNVLHIGRGKVTILKDKWSHYAKASVIRVTDSNGTDHVKLNAPDRSAEPILIDLRDLRECPRCHQASHEADGSCLKCEEEALPTVTGDGE